MFYSFNIRTFVVLWLLIAFGRVVAGNFTMVILSIVMMITDKEIRKDFIKNGDLVELFKFLSFMAIYGDLYMRVVMNRNRDYERLRKAHKIFIGYELQDTERRK